ncbi:uncharacterized protein F5147DRAFT_656571 [Suillus discolor]|uniref:Uncharacterized protein n=1 Tax=Suillus discolor TaxID=1912936 RepID=A0A9P7EXF8_9AGAM|nr:uncharacterized protein F5147DRAFT_656571 [Suillus discolor]KAG2096493.1 hypothetical protein F5147DRAFT_656571 [Suillus discolor]
MSNSNQLTDSSPVPPDTTSVAPGLSSVQPPNKVRRFLSKVKDGVTKHIPVSRATELYWDLAEIINKRSKNLRTRDPVQDTSAVVQQGADSQSVNKALQDAGHGADQMNQIWGHARPVLSAGENGPAALDDVDSIETTYLQPLRTFDTVIGTIAGVCSLSSSLELD